ncbi:MAG: DUF6580 family putative transport protein [Patescibacteria group bacterium]
MYRNLVISIILILLVVTGRLIPHVWNVTPIIAVALLAGAVLPRRWAFVVPLLAMFLSDAIIGFYKLPVMLTVYGSFAASAIIGFWLRPEVGVNHTSRATRFNSFKIIGASITSSTIFFLTTNFAVWATADWYSKTMDGLLLSYTLGLPFFRNMLLGDIIFSGVLFGVWALAVNYFDLHVLSTSDKLAEVKGEYMSF